MGPAPSETPIASPPGPSDNSYYTAAEQSGTVQRDGVKKGCSGQVSNKSRLVSESADSRCGCVCAQQVSKQVLCSQALVSGQRRDEGGYLRPKKKKTHKGQCWHVWTGITRGFKGQAAAEMKPQWKLLSGVKGPQIWTQRCVCSQSKWFTRFFRAGVVQSAGSDR